MKASGVVPSSATLAMEPSSRTLSLKVRSARLPFRRRNTVAARHPRLALAGRAIATGDCTNNATLYGAYTKIGGICAITQYKIAGGVVIFDGCVNNGDIISSRTTTGVTGYAGILGYNDDDSVLVNCSNTGSIVNNSGANTDKDGALCRLGLHEGSFHRSVANRSRWQFRSQTGQDACL